MAKVGRPSKYNKKLAQQICSRIANGQTLTSICKDKKYPARGTVMRWLFEESVFRDEFRDLYARARESMAEVLADEIIDISDDDSEDYIFIEEDTKEGKSAKRVQNHEFVQRSRLKVDARKWYASKAAPRKYGDKTHLEHSGKVTIEDLICGDDES